MNVTIPYPLDLDYRRFLNFSDRQLPQLLTIHLLQNIERQQTSVEHRLERLQRHLSANDEQVSGGFPQFRCLPAEIRDLIWEMAIPRRKLRLFHHDERRLPSGRPAPLCGLPPPAISQVCRESRSVALRRAGMFHLCYPLVRPSPSSYWTWFDSSHDILELSRWCRPASYSAPIGLMEILRRAETILVHIKHIRPSWVTAMFQDLQVRQTLRTINVQRTYPEAVHKIRWIPHRAAKLFANDSVVMVYPGSIRQIRRLVSANPGYFSRTFDYWLNLRKLKEKKLKKGRTFAWAKETFMMAWLSQGDAKLEADCLGDNGLINQAIPWIQDSLLRMPRMRPVYAFELEDHLNIDCRVEPSHPEHHFSTESKLERNEEEDREGEVE